MRLWRLCILIALLSSPALGVTPAELFRAMHQVEAGGRMSAEVIRVLAAADEEARHRYPQTLFAESEAFQGSCTAKSTIYSASIAAGFMIGQLAKWLRGMPVDADVDLNLLAMEMAVVT